jgi:hypothetical protein
MTLNRNCCLNDRQVWDYRVYLVSKTTIHLSTRFKYEGDSFRDPVLLRNVTVGYLL